MRRRGSRLRKLVSGLFAYYKLDEISGTTVIDSKGSNNGTNNGATIGVAGKVGTAYSFSSGNSLNMGDPDILIRDAFSLAIWFKTSFAGTGQLISRHVTGGFWQFRLESGKVRLIRFHSGGNAQIVSPLAYNNNLWHFAVATFSIQNGSRIYIDGNLVVSDSVLTPNNSGAGQTIYIGSRGGTENYTGLLDEAAIYQNYELSASEITSLYNNGNGTTI